MTLVHRFHTLLSLDAWISSAQTWVVNMTTTDSPRGHRIPALLTAARSERAAHRAAAAERARLTRELADYTTAADRNDLNALLDSYPEADVAELRELLNTPVAA
jgi:hypothetical protein